MEVVVEVVVVVGSKVHAPVTGARGHVPTSHLWHNAVRYHVWEGDKRSSEQYQYPHVRLRELERPIDREPEPHTMYVKIDVFCPLHTH